MRLELYDVTKKYKDKLALDKFTLSMEEGIIGVLAPNGAGKTTLLKILATAIRASEGQIVLDGIDIIKLGQKYRERIGYLPQQFGVYPNMTVERFLKYFGALKDVKDINYEIDKLTNILSLQSIKKEKMKHISGGMKQRVGIAQALLNNPDILLLDEPTVGLDPDERIKLREFLFEIGEEKLVLLSTHIVSDIEAMATNIIFMKDGKLISYITPQDALKELKDKVYEVVTDVKGAREIKRTHLVSHTRNTIDGLSLRIISDGSQIKNSISVTPNLEDVYIYNNNMGVAYGAENI